MTRKRAVLLTFVALIALAALIFQKKGKQEGVTIRLIGEAVSTVDAIDKLKDEFTRETGIRVVVEKYEFEAALEKSTLDVASRAGTYDIFLQYGLALGRFATQGALLPTAEWPSPGPVDPTLATDLFPKAWRSLSWHMDKCYGYPFAANTMFVWYRKDLLEKPEERSNFRSRYGYDLKPPRTWKEYRDVAEFFTRPAQNFYGTTIQAKRHPAVWYEWLNFAYSYGGGVFEKEHPWQYGPIIINSLETLAATELYLSLKKSSPPGCTNFTWDDALAEMQQGRIFMCIMWSDAVFSVEDPKASKVAGKIGYMPIPVGPAGPLAQIAGGSYFISRYSRHPAEAARFALWAMTTKNQILQELNGGASARRSTYAEAKVQILPYAAAHVQSLDVGRHMSDTVPETPKIADIIELSLSDIVTEKRRPKEALDSAANDIHQLLGARAPLKFAPAKQ